MLFEINDSCFWEPLSNYNSWDFGKAAATAFTSVVVKICEQLNP